MKNAKEYKERRECQEYFTGYDMLTRDQLKDLRREFNNRKLYGEIPLEGCGIRATVWERGEAKFLTSYSTVVAILKHGQLFKIWDGWSATTAKHIKAFCKKYNVRIPTKYEWIMSNVGEPIKYEEV